MLVMLLQSSGSYLPIISSILRYINRFRGQSNRREEKYENPSMKYILKVFTIFKGERFSDAHERLLSLLVDEYGPHSFAIINAIGLDKFVVSPSYLAGWLRGKFSGLDRMKIDHADLYRVEFMNRYLPVMQWIRQSLAKSVANQAKSVLDNTLPALLIMTPRQQLGFWSPLLSHSLTTTGIRLFFELVKTAPDLGRDGVIERLKLCLDALVPSGPMVDGLTLETDDERTEWTDAMDLLAAETFVSLGFTCDQDTLVYLLGIHISPEAMSIFLKHRRVRALSDVHFNAAVTNSLAFVGLLIDHGFEMKNDHVKKLIECNGAGEEHTDRISSKARNQEFTGLPPWEGIDFPMALKKYAISEDPNPFSPPSWLGSYPSLDPGLEDNLDHFDLSDYFLDEPMELLF